MRGVRGSPGVRAALVAATLVAGAALAGCTAGDPSGAVSLTPLATATSTPPPASSAPPPSISPTPTDEEAIRQAYATFMDARNVSLNDPRKPPDRRLWQVSIPPARDGVSRLVLYYRQQGIRSAGDPLSKLSAIEVDGTDASFDDCLDLAGVRLTFSKSGESALAPNQNRYVPVHVAASNASGTWTISGWDPRKGESCGR